MQLEKLAAQHGFTISRVATAYRPEGKVYRYFLRAADGELAADGRSFDESEAQGYLEDREQTEIRG